MGLTGIVVMDFVHLAQDSDGNNCLFLRQGSLQFGLLLLQWEKRFQKFVECWALSS